VQTKRVTTNPVNELLHVLHIRHGVCETAGTEAASGILVQMKN